MLRGKDDECKGLGISGTASDDGRWVLINLTDWEGIFFIHVLWHAYQLIVMNS